MHHGRNEIYIDKNYGSTFNIWDKLFGTFQEETEKVVYGIKGPYKDNNPFMAIGYYFNYMWLSMKTQDALWQKFEILFLPPDRTPKPDFSVKRIWPVDKDFISRHVKNYAYIQLALFIPGMIILLLYKDFIPLWEFILYAAIGISTVCVSAMILNNNISVMFQKVEMARLWISLFCVIILFAKKEEFYMLGIVFLLMLTLVLFTTIKLKKELFEQKR